MLLNVSEMEKIETADYYGDIQHGHECVEMMIMDDIVRQYNRPVKWMFKKIYLEKFFKRRNLRLIVIQGH